MNPTHIHLLITHLPIFGAVLGGLVLGYGLWSKSNETKTAAYLLFILSSVGAVISYLTGEAAEETVENIQGIAETAIERHEEFALYALVSLLVLGVASVIGIFMTLRKSAWTRTIAVVVLLISLGSFGLAARTGYLGGQIRHTELTNDVNVPATPSGHDTDD